ncbi:MAG: hypothetical protein SPL89_06065 [Clostridia bacterium]|nr:hypothetical protein [Clostridia bacterium]
MSVLKNLCSCCERGRYTFELDEQCMICPYINFNDGTTCSKFIKLKESESDSQPSSEG